MSAIFDLEEWKKIAIRSTSGDQVWDIIASWEADSKSLSARLQRVIHEVQKYQPSGSPPPGDEAMLTRWIMSSLTASRDAWRKLALELEKRILVMDKPCCQSQAYHGDTHSPDCPIEQLRKMKEVEG